MTRSSSEELSVDVLSVADINLGISESESESKVSGWDGEGGGGLPLKRCKGCGWISSCLM